MAYIEKLQEFETAKRLETPGLDTPRSTVAFRPVTPDARIKRILDPVLAVIALLFFAPFMLTIAIVIILTDGWPVFFVQERVGLGGKTFRCFKFRSMACDADKRLEALLAADPAARAEWAAERKLRDDPRITCVGHFLRRSSLDELPQLLNVLKGDMSMVGPRPIVEAEISQYGEDFPAYTSVRPGITGLWQVSGRSDTSYPRRVALDCEYAANRSLKMDLWILLRTVKVVLKREGAR